MEGAQTARSVEERLVETLIVTNAYQQQTKALSNEVLPRLRQMDADDPDRDDAKRWVQHWTDEAGNSLMRWGEYLDGLVAQVGGEARAQEIADGAPRERITAVIEAARADASDAAPDGPDRVSEPSGQASTKQCPDCAEEVKAAARKCRFCGYRFDKPKPV